MSIIKLDVAIIPFLINSNFHYTVIANTIFFSPHYSYRSNHILVNKAIIRDKKCFAIIILRSLSHLLWRRTKWFWIIKRIRYVLKYIFSRTFIIYGISNTKYNQYRAFPRSENAKIFLLTLHIYSNYYYIPLNNFNFFSFSKIMNEFLFYKHWKLSSRIIFYMVLQKYYTPSSQLLEINKFFHHFYIYIKKYILRRDESGEFFFFLQ